MSKFASAGISGQGAPRFGSLAAFKKKGNKQAIVHNSRLSLVPDSDHVKHLRTQMSKIMNAANRQSKLNQQATMAEGKESSKGAETESELDDESNLEEDLEKLNDNEKKNNKSGGKGAGKDETPKGRESGTKEKSKPAARSSIKNSWVLFNAEVSNDFMNESDELEEN